MNAGALAYADDVTLLCPGLFGLNKMLEICEKFAQTFDVTFNPKKSVAMCMSKGHSVEGCVYLNGQKIEWKEEVKHLGSIVTSACVDDSDCKYKSSCFIGSVNKLLANFGNMRTQVKNRLFQSYCLVLRSGVCHVNIFLGCMFIGILLLRNCTSYLFVCTDGHWALL